MSKQATDVDRALAAIGMPMSYRSFGPLPIPKHDPELDQIFSYNDAGIGEYHPKAAPELEADLLPEIQLAGLPEQMPAAAPPAPAALPQPVAAPVMAAQPPAPLPSPATAKPALNVPLADAWRYRPDASPQTSALGAEQRSLAAMFNMLAGKTHGQIPLPKSGPDAASDAPTPRDTGADLFRRL